MWSGAAGSGMILLGVEETQTREALAGTSSAVPAGWAAHSQPRPNRMTLGP